MPDLTWFNHLEGKTREIAHAIYQSNLTDYEIAAKYESTVQYVQKTKSVMRNHGFEIPRHQSKAKVMGNGSSEAVKDALRQTDSTMINRVSREDLKNIYADFKQGMSPEDVAMKHGLLPDLTIQLWKGWQQITGRGGIARLCHLYGSKGVVEFHKIGEYLGHHKLSPKGLVELLDSIGSLQAYNSELQSDVKSLEDERNLVCEEVAEIKSSRALIQTELDQTKEEAKTAERELISTTERVYKLRESQDQNQRSLDYLIRAGREYVYGIGVEVANDVLVNDQALRERAVKDFLSAIASNPPTAMQILDAIAKGVRPNISVEEFRQKFEPLAEEGRKRLLEKFMPKLYDKVSEDSKVRIQPH